MEKEKLIETRDNLSYKIVELDYENLKKRLDMTSELLDLNKKIKELN